jgi:hypothetical protein
MIDVSMAFYKWPLSCQALVYATKVVYPSDMSIMSKCPFRKRDVHLIWIKTILTFNKIFCQR